MDEKFEHYAIVELFGRQIIAGMVREEIIGGQGFVRVDVPAVGGQEGFTKFYGANAIYAITPCDKVTAYTAVAGLRKAPIEVWKLNLPQLDAGEEER